MEFFSELKRRNVFRVGIAYAAAAWLILQIADLVLDAVPAPEWLMQGLLLVVVIGFPITLLLAWAYELTPEGIRRESEGIRSGSMTPRFGRKLDFVIIGVLAMALAVLGVERVFLTGDLDTDASGDGRGRAEKSIAVLPFADLSESRDQEWFADGLAEEILNALARVPDLLVTSRTSSFAYKKTLKDAPTIGHELRVAHILEGSVRRSTDRLRVTAQLIRASDGFHLWSDNYDRTPDDMITIQEDIAIEIANALETAMDPDALARMISSGTSSVPAFEAHLRGLSHANAWFLGDRDAGMKVLESYEEAVRLDPEFSLAYFQLAQFWSVQMETTNIGSGVTGLTPDEVREHYLAAADSAIEHEDDPVNKLFLKAKKAFNELNFVQALRLNTEFLKQRPDFRPAQVSQIILLGSLGMYAEGVDTISRFSRQDEPNAAVTDRTLSFMLYAGDDDALREYAKYAVEQFGDSVGVLYQAHRALLWAGDIESAREILPVIQNSEMPNTARYLSSLRQACAEGRLEDAARLYANIISGNRGIWLGHRIMGEEGKAVAVLMKLDDPSNLRPIANYLIRGHFDPRPFPNLMALLESQGVERRQVSEIPYRCSKT